MPGIPMEKKPAKKTAKQGKPLSRQQQKRREALFAAYWSTLHDLVDQIFEAATNEYDLTWNQLAVKADVAYTAVKGLGERITQRPQIYTIYRLAAVVGMDLKLTKIQSKHKTALKAVKKIAVKKAA